MLFVQVCLDSLHPKISVLLAFKFYSTKSVSLEIHIIKIMLNTKQNIKYQEKKIDKHTEPTTT